MRGCHCETRRTALHLVGSELVPPTAQPAMYALYTNGSIAAFQYIAFHIAHHPHPLTASIQDYHPSVRVAPKVPTGAGMGWPSNAALNTFGSVVLEGEK